MLNLDDAIDALKGVGESSANKLRRLGVHTIRDLVNYWPRAYQDFSQIQSVGDVKPGNISLQVSFSEIRSRYVRRGMHVTEAVASDESGSVKVVWFNQPYRKESLKPDTQYFLSGELAFHGNSFSITNPAVELTSSLPANTARILPIYRETKGLNSALLRKYIKQALPLIESYEEYLPVSVVSSAQVSSASEARKLIHFPESLEDVSRAKHRLAFEEAFGLTLSSQLAKQQQQKDRSVSVPFSKDVVQDFVSNLPFTLTPDQKRASWVVLNDMTLSHPMNRLIEGDVGSGKTAVAAVAGINALASGFQVALLAPTEVLATQHFQTLQTLLSDSRFAKNLHLLVGSQSKSAKQEIKLAVSKQATILVGTHALLEENVKLPNLGLIVVDEQHRFGVRQRQALLKKVGYMPHVLSLTATPIPRSLALTLYGELDTTLITTKPKGRKPIITTILNPNTLERGYKAIIEAVKNGQQAYIVCPLINSSDIIAHDSVSEVFERLQKTALKGFKLGLLHGKLRPQIKNEVMDEFRSGRIDVLVSTTVIEVGVDVPNATTMLILSADAFGLAQLHQLRGRIGRGEHGSTCFVVASSTAPPSRRLRAFASSNDGFHLADLDLELRGPGQIYGTQQHGALDLRMVRLTDRGLISMSQRLAVAFVKKRENLLDYPQLAAQIHRYQTITHLS